jgi:hypothetical protein
MKPKLSTPFKLMVEAVSRKENTKNIPANFELASDHSGAQPQVFCKHAARTII